MLEAVDATVDPLDMPEVSDMSLGGELQAAHRSAVSFWGFVGS